MRDFFRRKQQQPRPALISPEDRLIAAHNGYTPDAWNQLPAIAKVDIRELFYQWKGL